MRGGAVGYEGGAVGYEEYVCGQVGGGGAGKVGGGRNGIQSLDSEKGDMRVFASRYDGLDGVC